MKKILIASLITVFSLSAADKPDFEYEIDTWGSNSEVYEFTPKSDPNKWCIFVILDNMKSMSLQCFDKPQKKNNVEETR